MVPRRRAGRSVKVSGCGPAITHREADAADEASLKQPDWSE